MDKTALINTACEELLTYGVWDTKTRLKRGIKKYILRKPVTAQDLIFWPTGLLAYGLWHCRETLGDEKANDVSQEARESVAAKIDAAVNTYIGRWQKRGMPIAFLDDLLFGETLLSMYGKEQAALGEKPESAPLREAIERLAGYAMRYPTDAAGSFPYRAGQRNGYVFVDAVGLACPFLCGYGEMFGREECVELAVRQVTNYLRCGMDRATGLPYHGYDSNTGCKYGVIGWGRAVGWLLRGMAGCAKTAYGRERTGEAFVSLTDAALAYQREDGSFSWQLQALEGPKDTSATAMICAAVSEGVRLSLLSGERYLQALERGKASLMASVRDGRVYDCSGECEGFSCYPQRYGAYPWALGAALMLL